jgi:hypothetical protein
MNHPRRLIQSELKQTRGETGELERISIASPLGVQGIKARFEQLDNVASKTKVEVSRHTIRGGVVICPTAAVLIGQESAEEAEEGLREAEEGPGGLGRERDSIESGGE